ncbi:hypothetical protein TrVFT333_004779 [Trichoderma virens FT-333]|nr:hypothetical protein TrVFT333_004779 [Trichoderma virens FT-333]
MSQDRQNERMKDHADNPNIGNTSLSRPAYDDTLSFGTSPLELCFQPFLRIWPSNDVVFTTSYAHVAIAATATESSITTHIGSSNLLIGSRVWAQLHGDAAKQVQTFLHYLLIAQGMSLGILKGRQQQLDSLQPLAVKLSVEAAALALHGRLTKHTANVQQAIMIYQLALRQLRTQLSHMNINLISSPILNVSILTVVMNMTLFEMLLHMDEAQRTFLEEPRWQTIPWSDNPNQRSFANRYIDIVCCIPGILEDEKQRVKIRREHPGDDTTWSCNLRQSLRHRVIMLYHKLLNIRWEWELQHPICCFEISQECRTRGRRALSVNEATGQPIFNSVLYFTDFRRAVETNFYHSCLLILHDVARGLGIMDELKDNQASHSCFSHKTNSPLTFPHDIESDHNAVRDICRTVEFLLQSMHGPAGVYVLMFPLRVAQIYHDFRLPSRDYRKNKVNDTNAETSVPNVYRRGSDAHTVKSQSDVYLDKGSRGHNGSPSNLRHIDDAAGPHTYNSDKKQTTVVSEGSIVAKPEQQAVISEWIQRIMRHINDVHGFSVSKSYVSKNGS